MNKKAFNLHSIKKYILVLSLIILYYIISVIPITDAPLYSYENEPPKIRYEIEPPKIGEITPIMIPGCKTHLIPIDCKSVYNEKDLMDLFKTIFYEVKE